MIGKTGKVLGTLTCQDADIEGKIEGKLLVSNLLSIKSTAVIDGEVSTSKLAVEPGASFNASCVMNGNVKSLSNDKGKGQHRS